MATRQRKKEPPILTNYEGFEIPASRPSPKRDRYMYVLMGILNLVAVGIIVKQLKALGMVPAAVDTDFRGLMKLIPRNPIYLPPCGHLNSRHILLESENIVFPDGVAPGALLLKRGTIHHIYRSSDVSKGEIAAVARTVDNLGGEVLNVGSLVVSPGIIDVHTHFNEPGRLEWEGLFMGTSASAAGGVTTVVDMPLNCKPTITTPEHMKKKIRKIWHRAQIGVAMWGGLTGDNAHDHRSLSEMLELGAVGLKAFMCPSGINDFPPVTQHDIEGALALLMRHRKPLMLHAEVVSEVAQKCGGEDAAPEAVSDAPDGGHGTCDLREHSTWMSSRPAQFEVDAAKTIVAALRNVRSLRPELFKNATTWQRAEGDRSGAKLGNVPDGFKVHIAHLGAADALPIYEEAVKDGLPITIETCAHYLVFSNEDVPPGATQFKCAPPLRDSKNREELRRAARWGKIAVVSSDHSPSVVSMKAQDSGNFLEAWGGISGVQYTLPAVNSVGRENSWELTEMARMLSTAPAQLIGLSSRKGSIREGLDADLVVWDPQAWANTTQAACRHRWKLSPYIGKGMKGEVKMTLVQGGVVFNSEKGISTGKTCGGALFVKEGGNLLKELLG